MGTKNLYEKGPNPFFYSGQTYYGNGFLKKNQSAPRPSSEHPPVMGGKMSKRLVGGIKGSPMQITLGQQYYVWEKPTAIL